MECHILGKNICTYSRSNLQLTIFLANQSTLKQA